MEQTTKAQITFPHKKIDLLKDWKKAKPTALVMVCWHGKINKWDCGCSFGCSECHISYKCEDCGCGLSDRNKKIPTVKLA